MSPECGQVRDQCKDSDKIRTARSTNSGFQSASKEVAHRSDAGSALIHMGRREAAMVWAPNHAAGERNSTYHDSSRRNDTSDVPANPHMGHRARAPEAELEDDRRDRVQAPAYSAKCMSRAHCQDLGRQVSDTHRCGRYRDRQGRLQ